MVVANENTVQLIDLDMTPCRLDEAHEREMGFDNHSHLFAGIGVRVGKG